MTLVDGPPTTFDEDDAIAWCEWALDNGLPHLPETLAKGQSVPVARWAGPGFGAVLRVEWAWSEEPVHDDSLVSVVQVFRRTASGWEDATGDGGGGWFDPPFHPPGIGPGAVDARSIHSGGGEGWRCAARHGLVGSDITSVELVSGNVVTQRSIESPIGAVIVGFDASAPSMVRFLTKDGTVAEEVEFNPATPWL